MSVKLAIAKLSATAAGVALLGGGAVHVAEAPITDNPAYGSERPVKGKRIATAQPVPVRYVKTRNRTVPKPVQRKRRVVNRVVECEGAAGATHTGIPNANPGMVGSTGRIVETIENAAECAPVYRARMIPVPLPALPPVQGGGGSSGGVTVIGGGGGFGG
ncbi:MAG: hypothetical protein ABJJ48_01080, partial [Marinomonas sp.]